VSASDSSEQHPKRVRRKYGEKKVHSVFRNYLNNDFVVGEAAETAGKPRFIPVFSAGEIFFLEKNS